MHTMDQHLAELVNTGVVSYGVALEKAHDTETFERLVTRRDLNSAPTAQRMG
jgi:twitching motility protein PilT